MRTQVMALAVLALVGIGPGAAAAQPESPAGAGAAVRPDVRQLRERAERRYKVIEVTATIENTGMLPTQVANGPALRGNREDVIWLIGAKSFR